MFKVNSPPPPPEKPVAGKPKPQYWSHYLQSKVARAEERLEAELKRPTAEAEGGAATTAEAKAKAGSEASSNSPPPPPPPQ